ncbi:peroxide stress protein YaaA [Salinispirillum sp. LH 10-3-1]|uniref:UPF0246 protein NFC81_07330 n=1 Tax=Salinispirillum sp. LH 10-3-1 TaxID=2952525 RepID=A0AB38YJU0_9GAMM
MLAVISPAKTLDYKSSTPEHHVTDIRFPDEAATLVDRMRQFGVPDIQSLMGVSEKIAEENVERFSQWTWPYPSNAARAAIFAFKGDVYTGLDAYSLDQVELDYVNQHVRILSGLYGLLRPTDAILPYRLEMGKKVRTAASNDLYSFWGNKIAAQLGDDLAKVESNTLVNLASTEYFRSVAPYVKSLDVVTPVFKDWKNGQYKVISFFAKKARGSMVRYMAEHQLTKPEQLKAFDTDGYAFNAELSSNREWVFLRKQG